MAKLADHARRSLIRSINQREFLEGDLLPPSDSLAVRLGCSTATVDRALAELARQGVVKRVRRKGTVVLSGGEMIKRVGRVALVQSYDNHLNNLLTDPIYAKLHDHGFDVDVLPLAIKDGLTAHRLEKLTKDEWAAEFLVMIEPPPRKPVGWLPHGDYSRIWPVSDGYPWRVAFNVANSHDNPGSHIVTMDHMRSARLVVEHLIQLGHRRVAIEAGYTEHENTWPADVARFARELLELSGAECIPLYLSGVDPAEEARALLTTGATAVWTVTDYGAMILINRLAALSAQVPARLSVVGRFDTPWSGLADPPITSVSINPPAVADAVTAALLHMATTASMPPNSQTIVKPSLVVRQSTGRPPADLKA